MLHPGALTVNAAIPCLVELEIDDGGPTGGVSHSCDGAPPTTLTEQDSSSDLTAAVCFALRPEGGVNVQVSRQAPMGSGIGGSSAYAVALSTALLDLEGRTVEDRELVPLLRDLEARIMGVPAGTQDHWAAIRGGVLAVHLEPGGDRIEQLDTAPEWLENRMTVFFTGLTHHSGMVNWQVIRRRLEGDQTTSSALVEISEAARICRDAVLAHDEDTMAAAIRREWRARKTLAPDVCPPELEILERVALTAGATAVKATGAGGGGSLLLWHPEGAREAVVSAMCEATKLGEILASGTARSGCRCR